MKNLDLILRILAYVFGITGILFFINPLFRGSAINSGSVAGLALSLLLIAYGIFQKPIIACRGNLAYKIILGIFLLGLAFAIGISSYIISASLKKPAENSTLIVLGCKVRQSGPSQMLRTRIDAAYAYLEKHPDAVAVLSGGKGPDEHISEAECMYNELTKKGIAPSRLFIEDKSTSTIENFKFSLEIIEANNLSKKVAIATNEYHERRAQMIAKAQNIEEYGAVSAKTPFYLLPTYFIREIMGVVYMLLFGR